MCSFIFFLSSRSPQQGWGVICGDGFGVPESMVVCRSAGLGHAAGAFQTDQFGGLDMPVVLSAVECAGNESSLAHCYHQHMATCSSRKETVAAVACVRGECSSARQRLDDNAVNGPDNTFWLLRVCIRFLLKQCRALTGQYLTVLR